MYLPMQHQDETLDVLISRPSQYVTDTRCLNVVKIMSIDVSTLKTRQQIPIILAVKFQQICNHIMSSAFEVIGHQFNRMLTY